MSGIFLAAWMMMGLCCPVMTEQVESRVAAFPYVGHNVMAKLTGVEEVVKSIQQTLLYSTVGVESDLDTKLQALETKLTARLTATETKLENTETELKETKTELRETKMELKETKTKLDTTETELKEIKSKLDTTETELKETNMELKETKTKLDTTETELKETKEELKVTKTKLDTTDTELNATQSNLEATKTALQTALIQFTRNGGSTFVRWGRTNCTSSSQLVYSGVAGGSAYSDPGAAANPLCLTLHPQLDNTPVPPADRRARLFGSEYEDMPNHSGHDVPCSVCLATQSTTIMIPAAVDCPSGWTTQYTGHLIAGNHKQAGASQYVCLDDIPEHVLSGEKHKGGYEVFYTVTECGNLPCPPYVGNKVVLCVVCSK